MDSSLGRLQLAIELITMIFKEVDDLYDAIMLGLTHDTLMVIGWEHIRALLVQDSAPWAGTRIIIAGDYADDVPEGLISEEEKEEFSRLYLKEVGEELETLNLYRVFYSLFDEDESPTTRKDYDRLWSLSREEMSLAYRITERERDKYQSEKGWVLMNQTKEEYVTSMAASRILPSMDATDARCFGELIYSRICWSLDCSTAMRLRRDLHRGVWAGDRFVIVAMDDFEAMPSAKGWKDVSAEAAEWVNAILFANDEDEEY